MSALDTTRLIEARIEQIEELAGALLDTGKFIVLPNKNVPYRAVTAALFKLIGSKEKMFSRDGIATEFLPSGGMEVVKPPRLMAVLDGYAQTVTLQFNKDGDLQVHPSRLGSEVARALLSSDEARLLPPIRLVSRQPVLVLDDAGKPRILEKGYHREFATFVQNDESLPVVPVVEAVRAIRELYQDFEFVTPADESRVIALLLTPAIQAAKLVPGAHAYPVGFYQADQSQAGKGLLDRLKHHIYGEKLLAVTQHMSGVGSNEERISKALLSGARFITLDNWRGNLDIPLLESLTTNLNGEMLCRVAYREDVSVDASGVSFSITSNGISSTRDLANRVCIVNIRKQRNGRPWAQFKGSDCRAVSVELYAQQRQGYLLGCVYAIVKVWIEAGRPQDTNLGEELVEGESDRGFDLKDWAWALNWIVRNVFDLPPLLEGHKEAKADTIGNVNPKLRSIALAVQRQKMLDKVLAATDLGDIVAREGLDLFSAQAGHDDDPVARLPKEVGKLMSRAFPTVDVQHVAVGDLTVHRFTFDVRNEQRQLRVTHRYYVTGRTLTLDERAAIEKVARTESQRAPESETAVTPLRRKKY